MISKPIGQGFNLALIILSVQLHRFTIVIIINHLKVVVGEKNSIVCEKGKGTKAQSAESSRIIKTLQKPANTFAFPFPPFSNIINELR